MEAIRASRLKVKSNNQTTCLPANKTNQIESTKSLRQAPAQSTTYSIDHLCKERLGLLWALVLLQGCSPQMQCILNSAKKIRQPHSRALNARTATVTPPLSPPLLSSSSPTRRTDQLLRSFHSLPPLRINLLSLLMPRVLRLIITLLQYRHSISDVQRRLHAPYSSRKSVPEPQPTLPFFSHCK